MKDMPSIGEFIRKKRKAAGLTQTELAQKAGVGLRFIRELEGAKQTLRLDKVDQVLRLFGHSVGPVPIKRGVDDE
jgi:y4mF family transcriptional regulator